MTEKEIKKLNRRDLLVLLAEQTARADRLEASIKKAEEKLMERQLVQEECGTMAEAAMRLSAVFQTADEAAAMYLESVRQMKERQENLLQDVESAGQKKKDEIIAQAEAKAAQILEDAEKVMQDARGKAEQIISQAEETAQQKNLYAEELVRKAQETAECELSKIDAHWNEISERIQGMEKEYSWLRGILNKNTGERR